jgi:AraC-like DNA-binding protein
MNKRDTTVSLEAARGDDVRALLAARIARWTTAGTDLSATAIPGLLVYRREAPTEPMSCMVEASVALVVQGAKRVLLGGEAYNYDTRRFLITSLDLPVVASVIEASPQRPCLGLVFRLDPRVMAELMAQSSLAAPREQPMGRGLILGETTLPLLDAFGRLMALLDEPEGIAALAPLIEREILYRLLVSDQGARLRQIASVGTHGQRIARAIDWLRTHYAQALRIDELAASVQMSPSSFHQHFRSLTAMSPLQFQKWLRLNEARRLMLTERLDASTAAFQVGYESPSQFSREYGRLFGAPPRRDIEGLRRLPGPGAAILPT